MTQFHYIVTIETDTKDHADHAMTERLDYDRAYEDYDGVEYEHIVAHWEATDPPPVERRGTGLYGGRP